MHNDYGWQRFRVKMPIKCIIRLLVNSLSIINVNCVRFKTSYNQLTKITHSINNYYACYSLFVLSMLRRRIARLTDFLHIILLPECQYSASGWFSSYRHAVVSPNVSSPAFTAFFYWVGCPYMASYCPLISPFVCLHCMSAK